MVMITLGVLTGVALVNAIYPVDKGIVIGPFDNKAAEASVQPSPTQPEKDDEDRGGTQCGADATLPEEAGRSEGGTEGSTTTEITTDKEEGAKRVTPPLPMTPREVAKEVAWFASTDGVKCHAWVYWPVTDAMSRSGKGLPAVILAHGFGQLKDFGLAYYASMFCSEGIAVLVFDYRGFGFSEGEPRHLISPKKQVEDWIAAFDYLVGDQGKLAGKIDPGRVALWGTSFSGGHVITAASQRPSVRCVVCQAPLLTSLHLLNVHTRGYMGSGRLWAAAATDRIRNFMGLSPAYVRIAAEKKGDLALMLLSETEYQAFQGLQHHSTEGHNNNNNNSPQSQHPTLPSSSPSHSAPPPSRPDSHTAISDDVMSGGEGHRTDDGGSGDAVVIQETVVGQNDGTAATDACNTSSPCDVSEQLRTGDVATGAGQGGVDSETPTTKNNEGVGCETRREGNAGTGVEAEGRDWLNLAPSRVLFELMEYNPMKSVDAVKCPVLFIAGEKDTLAQLATVMTAFERVQQGSLYTCDADHFELLSCDTHRERVGQVASDFLQSQFMFSDESDE